MEKAVKGFLALPDHSHQILTIAELLGSIASEKDANTLNEGQQDAPHHRRAHHSQRTTWEAERDTAEEGQAEQGKDWVRGWIHSLRAASTAPVNAPLVMEFQGSSLPRSRTRPQSMVENRPPHTAKLPVGRTESKSDILRLYVAQHLKTSKI